MGDTRGNPPDRRGPLDGVRGRSDPGPELRRHLGQAPLDYLEGALSNPELDEVGAAILLKNPRATAALLVRISRVVRWTRVYEVKRGLVRHARSPLPLARRFLPHLLWLDLADAAADTRLSPVVRRHAEEALKKRLLDMAEGEIVALARRASPGVVAELIRSRSPRVLSALLGNPRVRERDVLQIASGDHAPKETLRRLVHHPEWGRSRSVRVALLRNARTPVADALHLLAGLPPPDLERVVSDEDVPRIVQIGAGRRLAAERP